MDGFRPFRHNQINKLLTQTTLGFLHPAEQTVWNKKTQFCTTHIISVTNLQLSTTITMKTKNYFKKFKRLMINEKSGAKS